MRLGLILLSLLCLPWALSAQKAEITGQVTEAESNEALFAVNVVIKGSTKGVTTDFDGNYSLMVDPGSYTVQFSFLGFETIERNLEVSADQVYTLNIQLSKKAEVISGVTVSSEGKFEKDLSETTVSMEVVKESFITQNATTSADETLNKIPGVQILGEGASIRGGSGFSAGAGSRVLFLVDGLPMFTPDNGTVQFESMPTENLAQIEVIKGASSALYGSSALNGVINFQTADPTTTAKNKVMLNFGFYNQPPNRDVSWNWRQPDTAKGTVRTTLRKFGNGSFSHSKKYKTLDVSFGANYKQDAGYLESGDQTRIRLGGKLKWRPKNFMRLNLGLNANFTYESAGFFFFWNGLDSAQYVPFREEYGQTTMRTVAIDPFVNFYDKKDNRHSLKFRFYNTETDNTNEEYVNSNMYFMDYTFLKRYEEKDFNITTGATGYVTNSRTQTFGDHSSGNLGMYAQFEKRFADVVTVNAGVRLEYYQVDSIKTEHKLTVLNTIFNRDSTNLLTSPVKPVVRMGLNWQITEGTNLRASFGQGYRFPTAAELFVRINRAGAYVYPNPDLIPETGWSAEIGIKQGLKVGNWIGYVDFCGFITQYKNMIEFRGGVWGQPTDPVGGFGFKSINITNARIPGFEVSSFGSGELFGFPFQYLLGYTFTYPIDLDYDPADPNSQKFLPYRNLHNFKADLQATFLKGLNVGIASIYIGYLEVIDQTYEGVIPGLEQWRDENDNGYWVFDLRLGYTFSEQFKANFIIKNIFNEMYTLRPAFLEAPRSMTFSLQYDF